MHSCSCKTLALFGCCRTDWLEKYQQKNVIFDTIMFLQCLFNLTADPCYNYQNLGDANRKSSYATSQFGPVFCDDLLSAR